MQLGRQNEVAHNGVEQRAQICSDQGHGDNDRPCDQRRQKPILNGRDAAFGIGAEPIAIGLDDVAHSHSRSLCPATRRPGILILGSITGSSTPQVGTTSLPAMVLNSVVRFVPTRVTATMIAPAINAARSPYSIAVTPLSESTPSQTP